MHESTYPTLFLGVSSILSILSISLINTKLPFLLNRNHVTFKTQLFSTWLLVGLPFSAISASDVAGLAWPEMLRGLHNQ